MIYNEAPVITPLASTVASTNYVLPYKHGTGKPSRHNEMRAVRLRFRLQVLISGLIPLGGIDATVLDRNIWIFLLAMPRCSLPDNTSDYPAASTWGKGHTTGDYPAARHGSQSTGDNSKNNKLVKYQKTKLISL